MADFVEGVVPAAVRHAEVMNTVVEVCVLEALPVCAEGNCTAHVAVADWTARSRHAGAACNVVRFAECLVIHLKKDAQQSSQGVLVGVLGSQPATWVEPLMVILHVKVKS